MSGVFGVVDPGRSSDVDALTDRMAHAMSHREWFVTDRLVDHTRNLAIGRVGIGIFNRERQPVYSEDQSLMIFLSGELHNTAELRRQLKAKRRPLRDDGDLELVLQLYEKEEEQFIHHLEGAFVLAIWDRSRQKLIIANDRFGLYPLYYAHYDGKLLFAPEMKGVLCDSSFPKELDLTALAGYIRFQHLLGDRTFFVGLKLLPSASVLRYDIESDRLTIRPYWDFSEIPRLPTSLTFGEAVEEAGRLLEAAVSKLTRGGYRFGVYLSGGVDSRAILGLIDRDAFPITTITYGQPGCRDVVYAQKIAARVGADHHYFEFSDGEWVKDFVGFHLDLTEGFHSWIHAHGISILDQVRPLIEVNLTGFGGEQSAIAWEDPVLLQAQDDIAFSCRLFELLSQKTTWPSICDVEERLLFSPRVSSEVRCLAFRSLCSELANYDYLPHAQRAAYFALCNPDRRLFQYYTVFHRAHFEQRFPFYDYRYFEFVYALPAEMLLDRRLRRAIIFGRMPSLAGIPYDRDDLPITGGRVSYAVAKLMQKSRSCINRYVAPVFPEHATLYADYEHWLRNELREWGEEILLGEQTLRRGIFNAEFLRSLWCRHQSGLEMHTIGKIAPIMTYEMMLRQYWD
jgi:asparagine synthase (glutamine-hydrolysing)